MVMKLGPQARCGRCGRGGQPRWHGSAGPRPGDEGTGP